jgi:hypothetical protein
VSGFGAFALFCFTLAVSLPSLGTLAAFALASGVAVLAQGLLIAGDGARARAGRPSTARLAREPAAANEA